MPGGSFDGPPRVPDQVIEAIRRHAEEPEIAVHSLRVWGSSQSKWQFEAEFEIDAVRGALAALPENILRTEARKQVEEVVGTVYEKRDG